MYNRCYGVQLNHDARTMAVYHNYEEGFKAFEITMPEVNLSKFERLPEFHSVLQGLMDKDDKVELYLRLPSLSFTGALKHEIIVAMFKFCKEQGFKGLVLKPGEALSTDANHVREAKNAISAFMSRYGHLCRINRVNVFWESSSSGFGSVENIIDIMLDSHYSCNAFHNFFHSKLCLENYVKGKYTLKEACEHASEIFFTDYEGDHSEILRLARGLSNKTVFVPSGKEYSFKCKLIWEESLTDW